MVRNSCSDKDVSEARRVRLVPSRGIYRVLTFWPGRYGQDVVKGNAELHVSVEPFTSYYIGRRTASSASKTSNKEAMGIGESAQWS